MAAGIDWSGWAVFGLLATSGLTAVLIAAQMAGLTRLDLPLVLGSIVTDLVDKRALAETQGIRARAEVAKMLWALENQ